MNRVVSKLLYSSEKFSNLLYTADAVMLTGSYALNEQTTDSDIDIIILSKNVNYIYSETTNSENQCVQFLFFPYFKFQNIIINDYREGKGVYTSMISKGIILKDSDELILANAKKKILEVGRESRCDHLDYALIHKITTTLELLKGSKLSSETVFCTSELLLDISRLVLGKYTANAKHLSRLLSEDSRVIHLIESFKYFVSTNILDKFIYEVESIVSNYGYPQHVYTTAWVHNFSHNYHIVFFVSPESLKRELFHKYLTDIYEIFSDYCVYGFYEGKNQLMEEGYYIYIFDDKMDNESKLSKLEVYCNTLIREALKDNISFSFPYKTLFHEGLQFGGKVIFNKLLPFFEKIWSQYVFMDSIITTVYAKKNSVMFGVSFLLQLTRKSRYVSCEISNILLMLYNSLFLEAVDPNGMYNIFQIGTLKQDTFRAYLSCSEENGDAMNDLITLIESGAIPELNEFNMMIEELLRFINTLSDDDLEFPNIAPINNKRMVLLHNVSIHIMSIIELAPYQKFGVVFNFIYGKL